MDLHRGVIALDVEAWALSEMEYFEYEQLESGMVRMAARSGLHDDFVIALALARRSAGMRRGDGEAQGSGRGQLPYPAWDA